MSRAAAAACTPVIPVLPTRSAGNPTVGEWEELRPAMDAARERGLKVSLEAEVRRLHRQAADCCGESTHVHRGLL